MCWGNNEYGQASPPSDERFTAISAGGYHTCSLREDGAAVCWGDNGNEQSSPPDGTFTAINPGYKRTCGLLEGGKAICWGYEYKAEDSPDGTFTAISTGAGGLNYGSDYACGLLEDGRAVCWGEDRKSGRTRPPHVREWRDVIIVVHVPYLP